MQREHLELTLVVLELRSEPRAPDLTIYFVIYRQAVVGWRDSHVSQNEITTSRGFLQSRAVATKPLFVLACIHPVDARRRKGADPTLTRRLG